MTDSKEPDIPPKDRIRGPLYNELEGLESLPEDVKKSEAVRDRIEELREEIKRIEEG